MVKVPSLKRVFDAQDDPASFEPAELRKLLVEMEEWECEDDEWESGIKGEVMEQWKELMDNASNLPSKKRKKVEKEDKENDTGLSEQGVDEDDEESEPKKSKKKKAQSKYDRKAQKNLSTFVGALGEGLINAFTGGGGQDGSDFDEDDGMDDSSVDLEDGGASESSNAVASSSTGPSSLSSTKKKTKKPAAPKSTASTTATKKKKASEEGKKRKSSASEKQVKSSEFVSDSDDSSHDRPPSKPIKGGRMKGKAKESSSGIEGVEDDGEKKKKGKKRKSSEGAVEVKGKGKEKKPKKERKPAAAKEGDAAKGTAEEEARIKKMKTLISTANGPRPYTAATGAERTLTVARRTELLEGILAGLDLAVIDEKLPTMKRADQVGAAREVDKDMASLSGTIHTSGLCDGKHVHTSTSDSDLDPATLDPGSKEFKKAVLAKRKSFGAFLGDQSSDSD